MERSKLAILKLDGPLDLEPTLHSGQAFRWTGTPESGYFGYVRNRPVRIANVDGHLEWAAAGGLSEVDLRRYFRLDRGHVRYLEQVRRDEALGVALDAFPGLRLLAQDSWEVFVAYIVSANSNIAKISRTLEALCRTAGDPIEWAGRTWQTFPTPQRLASLTESELRSTGMGYRAPNLRAAARLVAAGELDLDRLAQSSYEDSHARLVEVPGIGPKVADCIQLYGLGQLEAFPVDVWMERVVRESYFPRKRLNYKTIGAWSRHHFGPWAGCAQHHLFHYRRVVGRLPRVASSQATRRRARAVSLSTRAVAIRGEGGNFTDA